MYIIAMLLHCVISSFIHHLAVEERGGKVTGRCYIKIIIYSGKLLGRIYGEFISPSYCSDRIQWMKLSASDDIVGGNYLSGILVGRIKYNDKIVGAIRLLSLYRK